ncbi:unnamed protein product [Agarophyton chilense]
MALHDAAPDNTLHLDDNPQTPPLPGELQDTPFSPLTPTPTESSSVLSEPRLTLLSSRPPESQPRPSPGPVAVYKSKLRANPSVRFAKQLFNNAVNKVEDVGYGLLGVTDVALVAGEGVGRTAVSSVGAVGSVVEEGVVNVFSSAKSTKVIIPREVDTIKEVDISGTILKDLNRAIEVEKMKGTSNADSPLNTPWILLIFPILPIAFMYTKTALYIAVPPFMRVLVTVWTFFGWRFWFCLAILVCLALVFAWNSVKNIEPLRPITMQVDVVVIKFSRKMHAQVHKQMPKVYKALDKIFPPITAALVALDRTITPKLGYSPLLAINAKINGWIYDPKIREIRVTEEDQVTVSSPSVSPSAALSPSPAVESPLKGSIIQKRDRGQAFVVSEAGELVSQPAGDGLEFDDDRVGERVTAHSEGAGEMFEQFFNVEICLRHLAELHAKYTSVWVEWIYNGMVVDRSVIRDISTSDDWKGFGASFDSYTLQGEVRLPLRADTTIVKGGFFDVHAGLTTD